MKFSQAPRFQEAFTSKTGLQGTVLGAQNLHKFIPRSVRALKEPPLAGFAAGLRHSDFVKFLSYLSPLKTASMINTLYGEGALERSKDEPSWTVFNSKVVKEATKLLQNPENQLDRVQYNVHWAPFLKSVRELKKIASQRAAQDKPQAENKYLGIENHNLTAIQQVAGIKDEVISVREVGNDSAVAHQRASLPAFFKVVVA